MNKEERLLEKLKSESKRLMTPEKNFHDFAHVMGVYSNMQNLLKHEPGNSLVLLTSALFHDVKRDLPNHGREGAIYTTGLLKTIPEFPGELIEPVAAIIRAHDTQQNTPEEKLFYDADKMDAFNPLSLARSFMMFSRDGLTLREACNKYSELLDMWFNKLHTQTARTLVQKNYEEFKQFVLRLTGRY